MAEMENTPDDMVERVARALLLKFLYPNQATPVDWSDEEDELQAIYRPAARDAIAAMREPTEAMIAAGIDEAESCTDNWTASAPCIAEHLWPAMIDAALTPPGETK